MSKVLSIKKLLLTTEEAAEILGKSPQTLRQWRCAGKGPKYVRCGESKHSPASYRYTDLEDFVNGIFAKKYGGD